MNRRFRFVYDITGGALTLAPPWSGDIERQRFCIRISTDGEPTTADIAIWDFKDELRGVPIHRGLRAQVDIDGTELFSAAEDAGARLHYLLCAATVVAGASIGDPLLALGFETTPGIEQTKFVQTYYLSAALHDMDIFRHRRAVDGKGWEALIGPLLATADARVTRAAIWYCLALSHEDPLDRFVAFWTGLENLNQPLMDRNLIAPEMGRCKNCDAPYEMPQNKGVRWLFEQHSPDGVSDFTKCRNFRVGIMHGHGSFADVNHQASEYATLCESMLQLGMYILLGLDPEEARRLSTPVYDSGRVYFQFQGTYEAPPIGLTGEPFVRVVRSEVTVNDRAGLRHVGVRPAVESALPAAIKASVTLFYGDGDYTALDDIALPAREPE